MKDLYYIVLILLACLSGCVSHDRAMPDHDQENSAYWPRIRVHLTTSGEGGEIASVRSAILDTIDQNRVIENTHYKNHPIRSAFGGEIFDYDLNGDLIEISHAGLMVFIEFPNPELKTEYRDFVDQLTAAIQKRIPAGKISEEIILNTGKVF